MSSLNLIAIPAPQIVAGWGDDPDVNADALSVLRTLWRGEVVAIDLFVLGGAEDRLRSVLIAAPTAWTQPWPWADFTSDNQHEAIAAQFAWDAVSKAGVRTLERSAWAEDRSRRFAKGLDDLRRATSVRAHAMTASLTSQGIYSSLCPLDAEFLPRTLEYPEAEADDVFSLIAHEIAEMLWIED